MGNAHGFWAKQFVQHVDFIFEFADYYDIPLPHRISSALDRVRGMWQQIRETRESPGLSLCNKTLLLKQQVLQRVKSPSVKRRIKGSIHCLPDLLKHMIGEVQYYTKNFVLPLPKTKSGKLSPARVQANLRYWAREHAENLKFADCQILAFWKESYMGRFNFRLSSSMIPFPLEWKQIAKENKLLAKRFDNLQKRKPSGGYRKIDSKRFSKLNKLHMLGTKKAIKSLPNLRLSSQIQSMLRKTLIHEYNESVFAQKTIE